ncbi:SUF system Fe-S cluster assembly protein [Parablastomonas sp. CN1-191]|uniref:SUF system Fe-S cluster assembly protein n=1 Tax=Parablastomonas sp. CN1-191 TaxID=3400908 RepID=UPI003BF8EBE8
MNNEPKFTVEEVDAVPQPPRVTVEQLEAQVSPAMRDAIDAAVESSDETPAEKLGRKRDYLEGFLKAAPTGIPAGQPGGDLYEGVIAALKDIFDPEIPVNIYDLGLIYGVDVSNEGAAVVTMTLTTPHCPVAESMPGEVEMRVAAVPGVRDCEVNLVWDPPWDPAKMTDEARLELGML